MIVKGSLPPSTAWLSDLSHWPRLTREHPRFVSTLPFLYEVLQKLLVRTLKTRQQSLAVYGLGRMCVEDFNEILFMVENSFDIAGLRLLRGLYERGITTEVISVNENDANLFYNYHAVSARKAHQRAKQVYSNQWSPANVKENVGDWYEGDCAKREMMYTEEGSLAISTAHALMCLVVDTQNRFFNLGLDDDLQRIYMDCMATWSDSAQQTDHVEE